MAAVSPRPSCAKHRVPLGPRGCPRCAQEDVRAHREEARRFWRQVTWVAVPLLVVAVTYMAWPRGPARPALLDPEEFRNELETIESVFYRGDRLTDDDRAALAQGLDALVGRLRSRPQTAPKRRARAGMEEFLVVTSLDVERDRLDLPAIRHRWQSLRGEYFADAQWLEHGSAALEAAQRSSESRGVPPDVAAYDRSLETIRAEFAWARVVADHLPYNVEDVGDAYDGWRRDRDRLKEDVDRIRSELPLKRDDVDPAWKSALYQLDRALTNVGQILNPDARTPTLMPHPSTAWQRAQVAQAGIERAAETIASAPR
jgi:hypothetical protein